MINFTQHLAKYLPILHWSQGYGVQDFRADLIAGTVVLFVTVPQVIAYSFLAGMPPQAGLYGALFALVLYAFLGSSRALAVGPTAIIAMMTLEVATLHAESGSDAYITVVVQLSLITGMLLIALRIINFGSVVSFLSHAVVTGFISAAAVLIIGNQINILLGLPASGDKSLAGLGHHLWVSLGETNSMALVISIGALTLLVFCRGKLGWLLKRLGLAESLIEGLVKSAPLYLVISGILVTHIFELESTVSVVGEIPSDLPDISLLWISWATLKTLGPSAFLIALVVFMESTSIGTAMASKSRGKIDANQELLALGASNVGSSLVGAFPVAGSFARSAVNFSVGAVSPLASIVTALLLVFTILLLAPFFAGLPKAILAAIIVISAWQLVDVAAVKKIFAFNTTDAITFSFTFLSVLCFGVEVGVLTGVLISFLLLIRNSSKPNIAVVGRIGESEHFRNVDRYEASTSKKVLPIRVDESFYFVNTRFIETYVLNELAKRQEVEHILLICTATNFIDTSGLEMLEELSENLNEAGVTLHLAEVKGPVMDKLKETSFYTNMHGRVFFTTDIAMRELAGI